MSTDPSDLLRRLEAGELHRFADWPNPRVPRVAAGVYTIWDAGRLMYAGMAGRSLTVDSVRRGQDAGKATGLYSRLNSHASGRRSGDQFCVYVADRLLLQELDDAQIEAIARRELNFDALICEYVHKRLTYRCVETEDGSTARLLESEVRAGGLSAGKPLLNPA
jgi:hypothetical protein